ncbi:hypothetical protein CEJ39_17555 [Rhodococcus pyridinivorans]|nr:hypothetical protein IM25_20655 [Rhodococcus sp. p52]AWZ25733.1 hypothetical protein CEJ39_17555 [Rhodococcus pyridinivorans]KHJ72620.1 hypothetical protein QR64_10135 [Rhodococcus sp. Chr-9]
MRGDEPHERPVRPGRVRSVLRPGAVSVEPARYWVRPWVVTARTEPVATARSGPIASVSAGHRMRVRMA